MSNQEKKKATWSVEETECFIAIIKELQVITLMDGKKFRTSDIFKKVEEVFKSKGYNKTQTQLLEKFKAMKKRFKATMGALSVSGAGTKAKGKCPFFEELNEIFGHRPIIHQSGIDSTILPSNSNIETCDEDCASNAEIITSKHRDESQIEHDRHSSRSPTSIHHKRSSSNTLHGPSLPPSPISGNLSEDSKAGLSSFNSCELSSSDESYVFSKKRKICKSPTYPKRDGPRSVFKNMQNFAQQIIESQEGLLTKTIEEQRKHDREMFNQYNDLFLQQTQMLLTGLQSLSSPFPTNYSTYSGVSTVPPINPMFTKPLLNQPYSVSSMCSRQNDENNTSHSYTSHKMQICPKSGKSEKAVSELTTRPPSNFIRPKTIHGHISPLGQNPSQSENAEDEDVNYEDIEYLDYNEND